MSRFRKLLAELGAKPGRTPSQETDRPDRRLNRMAVPRGHDRGRRTPRVTDAKGWQTCDNRADGTRFLGPATEAGAFARSIVDDRSHAMTAAADRHLLFGLLAL